MLEVIKLRLLALALFCLAVTCSLAAQIVATSVCDILANPQSFDGKTVRVKATVISGFDEFVLKGSCNQPINAIWLSYPAGTKAKAGPAAFLHLQLARNNLAAPSNANLSAVSLEKSKDFKQFDSLLSTPYKSGGMCLGCIRYTVNATLIGRLDGTNSPGAARDKSGKFISVSGFGNLNCYAARLVLQSVADVSPQEIDYSKNAAATKGDSQSDSATGDPVAAAHRAARAFPSGGPLADQMEKAATAFGNEGEDNGVEVGVGTANEVSKNDGAKGDHDSPDGLLFDCTFDMDRLKGDALAKAISHVGRHIADIRGTQLTTPDASLYGFEYRAWQTTVLNAVATHRKTLILPGGYLVWNSSWAATDRDKMMDESISQFLSEWASLTRTRPAP